MLQLYRMKQFHFPYHRAQHRSVQLPIKLQIQIMIEIIVNDKKKKTVYKGG